jgi:putative transposase
MTHSYRLHYFHLIWSTKNRLPSITSEVRSELYPYLAGIAKNHGSHLLDIGGMPEHVHLLLEMRVPDRFTGVVRDLKASSSSFVCKKFQPTERFAWQEGYGSFSVSHSSVEKVRAYIQNQERHHATLSFEDEFKKMLRCHDISYDERFVLG